MNGELAQDRVKLVALGPQPGHERNLISVPPNVHFLIPRHHLEPLTRVFEPPDQQERFPELDQVFAEECARREVRVKSPN